MRDSQSTAEAPLPGGAARPLRVLVIEDNLVDARLIQIMVSDAGGQAFEIERADRLEEGLKRLAAENFGLVLLDLSLPAGDGFSVAQRIQKHVRIPMIFLTASKCPEFRERARAVGAVGFFEKPFDTDALMCAIHLALSPPMYGAPPLGGRADSFPLN